MGFTSAASVTSRAVVPYTAFPPLPAYAGGLFLLHWPWSHLHRTLSGILPCEARTFLTCCLSAIAAAIICATQSFLVCIFFYHTEYINTELGFFTKSYKTAAVLRAVFVLCFTPHNFNNGINFLTSTHFQLHVITRMYWPNDFCFKCNHAA